MEPPDAKAGPTRGKNVYVFIKISCCEFIYTKMLILITFACTCQVLSLGIGASFDIHNRDGRHLEHKQHVLISHYVHGAIAQGNPGLQALRRETSRSTLAISFVLYNLQHRTAAILRMCLPRYASLGQEEFHSFLAPCGMLSGIAVGPIDREWELKIASSSSLNITIRHVVSFWHKVGCDSFPNLRITDSGRSHSTLIKLDVTICGNSPQQSHFSASSEVKVSWLSRMFDVNRERFLLSYETVFPGYANYNNDHTLQMCTSCSSRCTQDWLLAESDFFPLIYRGTEYIYTWYIAGGVLKAPTVHINKFRCTELSPEMDKTIMLTVYDAPLPILDSASWERDPSRVIKTLACSDTTLNDSHKSSIGDLTLIATMRNDYEMEFSASVVFTRIPCHNAECSLVTHDLSLGTPEHKGFRLLSQGTSQQRAIFRPYPRQESSPITFTELEIYFDGLTYAPCAMGGLFLYQLQPLRLIGQVCSPWTAEIWSGGFTQEDGTTRLHLGNRPVMFVIKTYKGLTEGSIKGRVMLGTCFGVINPGFRRRHLATSYYSASSSVQYKRHTTKFIHKAGCMILQYFQTDIPDCAQTEAYFQSISHNSHENLQAEIQIGTMTNMSAYPANLVLKFQGYNSRRRDLVCNYGICTNIRKAGDSCTYEDRKAGSVILYRRPGSSTTELRFNTFCMAVGFKMFLRAYFVTTQPELCWTSQKLRKWVEIKANSEAFTVMPSVPCSTLSLDGNILGSKGNVLNFVFTRPTVANNPCCVLHLSILAHPLLGGSLRRIIIYEPYSRPDLYFGDNILS